MVGPRNRAQGKNDQERCKENGQGYGGAGMPGDRQSHTETERSKERQRGSENRKWGAKASQGGALGAICKMLPRHPRIMGLVCEGCPSPCSPPQGPKCYVGGGGAAPGGLRPASTGLGSAFPHLFLSPALLS